jgi:DNA-binding HxlR family transcriptional regulator
MTRPTASDLPPPVRPSIPFVACPLRAGLGCLGRKWALVVLRDIAFLRDVTFGRILERNPGLTPRALSMRLRDLQTEGLIERRADPADGRRVHYRLTRQGVDAVPIVTAYIRYGIRYHANEVFADHSPRDLAETFPRDLDFLLGRLVRAPGRGARP